MRGIFDTRCAVDGLARSSGTAALLPPHVAPGAPSHPETSRAASDSSSLRIGACTTTPGRWRLGVDVLNAIDPLTLS